MKITRGARSRTSLVLLLGALSAFPALSIDMYLPGLPRMAHDLHAGAGAVQLTVTSFIVGLAIGQLVAGPLSDRWGRRPVLLVGLLAYVVSSLLCLVAPTAGLLVAARVCQSFGAAAATVLSRAIVRDHVHGTAMTRLLSMLMLVNGAATVVGPLLGGQLLVVGSWRTVFLALAAVGALLSVAAAVALPESLPPARRRTTGPSAGRRTFVALCHDGAFVRYVLASALLFAAMFVYISNSSLVLQDGYGLSPREYSLVFAANAVGIVVLGQVNAVLVGRVAGERVLLGTSLVLGALAAVGILVAVLARLPLVALLVPLFVLVSMLGPVLANATSLALAPHGDAAGAAASIQGVLQSLVGGVVATATSVVGGSAAHGLGVAMAVAMLLSAAAALGVFLLPGRSAVPTPRRELEGAAVQ